MQLTQLTRIAQGRQAEIFAWEAGSVLKLYRTPDAIGELEVEEAAMTAAKAANAPVPAALGRTEFGGRPGLIIERVHGVDMLSKLDRQPWTLPGIGPTMARCHAALHETIAPASVHGLKDVLAGRMRRSPLVPEAVRAFAIEALASLPDGDRLCHGDFHPGNIIVGARGPMVIDWPNSTRGDPHADVARTLLMMRMGERPEGGSVIVRRLERIGRKVIIARYLSTYRKLRGLDDGLLARWEIPVAAQRLTERIPEERDRLLALLDGRMGADRR